MLPGAEKFHAAVCSDTDLRCKCTVLNCRSVLVQSYNFVFDDVNEEDAPSDLSPGQTRSCVPAPGVRQSPKRAFSANNVKSTHSVAVRKYANFLVRKDNLFLWCKQSSIGGSILKSSSLYSLAMEPEVRYPY